MDEGDPLPLENPVLGGGRRSKKRTSILKQTETRAVLQDINPNTEASSPKSKPPLTTNPIEKKSRRVSFSRTQRVKEFQAGQDNLTVWHPDYTEKLGNSGTNDSNNSSANLSAAPNMTAAPNLSAAPNMTLATNMTTAPNLPLSRLSRVEDQLASLSPSKALPLNINIQLASASPNKFLPSHNVDTVDFLQSLPGNSEESSSDFLRSIARARNDSEESSEQESSFVRMLEKMSGSEQTKVGQEDMSCTMMDTTLFHAGGLDSDEEEDLSPGVDPVGFLAGLGTKPLELNAFTVEGDRTRIGGGMDITVGVGVREAERSIAKEPEKNLTVYGGVASTMDLTMANDVYRKMENNYSVFEGNQYSLPVGHKTKPNQEGHHPILEEVHHPQQHEVYHPTPDSLPNSNNSSFDSGGATATVKFSHLALANNTLLLPRKESEEDEEEDMTRAPVQFFQYDPAKPVTDHSVENVDDKTCVVEEDMEVTVAVTDQQQVNVKAESMSKASGAREVKHAQVESEKEVNMEINMAAPDASNDKDQIRSGGPGVEVSMDITRAAAANNTKCEGAPEPFKVEETMDITQATQNVTKFKEVNMELTQAAHIITKEAKVGSSGAKTSEEVYMNPVKIPSNKTSFGDFSMDITQATTDRTSVKEVVCVETSKAFTNVVSEDVCMDITREPVNVSNAVEDGMDLTRVTEVKQAQIPSSSRSNKSDNIDVSRTGPAAAGNDEMEMTGAVPQISVQLAGVDVGGRSFQKNLDSTKLSPKAGVEKDDLEPPRVEGGGSDDSAWETLHSTVHILAPSPVISPPAPTAPPRKSTGQLLREKFPSPVNEDPSPEMTRMIRQVPRFNTSVWEGDVTSFSPNVGEFESTRAINFYIPSPDQQNQESFPAKSREMALSLVKEADENSRMQETVNTSIKVQQVQERPNIQVDEARPLPEQEPTIPPVDEVEDALKIVAGQVQESEEPKQLELTSLSMAMEQTGTYNTSLLPDVELTQAPGECACHLIEGVGKGGQAEMVTTRCTVQHTLRKGEVETGEGSAGRERSKDNEENCSPPKRPRTSEHEVTPSEEPKSAGDLKQSLMELTLTNPLIPNNSPDTPENRSIESARVTHLPPSSSAQVPESSYPPPIERSLNDPQVRKDEHTTATGELPVDQKSPPPLLVTEKNVSTSFGHCVQDEGNNPPDLGTPLGVNIPPGPSVLRSENNSFVPDTNVMETSLSEPTENITEKSQFVPASNTLGKSLLVPEPSTEENIAPGQTMTSECSTSDDKPQYDHKSLYKAVVLENIQLTHDVPIQSPEPVPVSTPQQVPIQSPEPVSTPQQVPIRSPEPVPVSTFHPPSNSTLVAYQSNPSSVPVSASSDLVTPASPKSSLKILPTGQGSPNSEPSSSPKASLDLVQVSPQTSLQSMPLSAPQSSQRSEPEPSLGSMPGQLQNSLNVSSPPPHHSLPVSAPPCQNSVLTSSLPSQPAVPHISVPQPALVSTPQPIHPPDTTPAPLLHSVSIFADLAARQQTKPACSDCGEPSHLTWRMVKEMPHKQKAAFDWLDGTLMLIVWYGEKLPPKRSRKSVFGPCSVDHFTVNRLEFVSVHSHNLPQVELDDEDRIYNIAHHLITRKFPEAMMKEKCPNTYSLSSLLRTITGYIEPAKTFIKSIGHCMENFLPFSVEDNLVIVGLQSLPLVQGINFSVDFGSGLGSAPSTFQVVRTIGSVDTAAIEKVVKGVKAGPSYLKDLTDRLELYLREKERALTV